MENTAALLLGAHLAATAAMVGLIWFVQVVHYPLFRNVGADRFVEYERLHTRNTSFVVGPFMAIEGVAALIIFASPPGDLGRLLPLVGLALLAVIHASTVFLQVPMHTKLSAAFDEACADRLVKTNWIRTVGWSVRALVGIAMFAAV